MRKCYSLIGIAVAVSSLIVPQSALAQFSKVRPAQSLATVEATEAPARCDFAVKPREFKANSPFALLRSGKVAPSFAAKNNPVFRASASSVIYGTITYSDNWGDSNKIGIYSMPIGGEPTTTEVALLSSLSGTYGACLAGDKYVACTYQNILGILQLFTINVYDAETWELIASKEGSVGTTALDMTYDATTGHVYGCFYNEDGQGYRFASLDIETGTVTTIGALEEPFNGVAAAPDGTIYGITSAGKLFTVDKNTGATSLVGETGVATKYLVSATCDPVSGTLYYTSATEDENGYLYTINKETAAATLVYQYPGNDEVQGLFIPAPAAADKAPAATSELALSFVEGSLTGSVKFTTPISLYDGTAVAAGTAGLTYSILANGEEVATAPATYGKEVKATVTVPTAGEYEFIVTVSNEVGKSPRQRAKAFIGNGVPKAPTNVALVYADGKMKLTWDAVTKSADGGYINPEAVTYTVTRLLDNVVVAGGISATSFEESITEPADMTVYQYSVVATFAETASAAATSNSITLGAIIPPYTNSFEDAESLSGFTIADANDDGRSWKWYQGAVRIQYNTKLAMDDWFITPGVKMEGGKLYTFTVNVKAHKADAPERVEVKYGTAATAEAMTIDLIPSTEVATADYVTLKGAIVPSENGTYYVGIHGISDANQWYLYVDDLSIGAATDATAPAAPTGLAVTPDPTGALKANLTFTTPDKNIAGNTLTSLTKVEVYNGETLLETIEAPAPGVIIEKPYENLTNGVNTFTVVAYNESGKGLEASASAFIGINVPGAPENVNMTEISPAGTVQITWTAPQVDVDGNPIDASNITYIVADYVNNAWVPISEEISGYVFEYAAVPAGEQDFVQYAVFAKTVAGTGSGTYTPFIAVGTPYTLPYVESFANGGLSYILGTRKVAGSGTWGIATDGKTFSDVNSQDGDGGFIYFKGQSLNDEAAIFTGKINITGTNPALSFYYLPLGDDDINEITVKVDAGEGEATLETIPQTGEMGVWKKANIALNAYVGKTVQVYLYAKTLKKVYTIVDNICIAELVDNNLTAASITAPAAVEAGASFAVPVKVDNNGSLEATGYSVNLYADGKVVATKSELPALASFASTTVDFEVATNALMVGEHTYYAEVVYAADQDLTDNKTTTVTVNVKGNAYPVVTLTGTKDDATGGISLSWTAPDFGENEAVEYTETFENEAYESFTTDSFGPWTLKNFNTAKTYAIQDATFPGSGTGFGYILFDAESAGLNAAYAGYNGAPDASTGAGRCVSAFAHTAGANDAWLISPLLSGEAQTIKFMAHCLNTSYGDETFEVLYSTTDQEVESFTVVNVNGAASTAATLQWTEYSAELPAGAKYFAIRSTATDCFVLAVDDITFKGYINPNAGLEVVGYNIYRDGEKINDTPVTETSYLDTQASEGEHTYVVTVVYNRGESLPSNEVKVTSSGVDSIDADAAAKVSVEARTIVIANAEGADVMVVAADGKVVYNAAGESRTAVAVAPGVYVVKVATKVVKVVVK